MDASQGSSGELFHNGTSLERTFRTGQNREFPWSGLIREATLV